MSNLITESGNALITETGDSLVTDLGAPGDLVPLSLTTRGMLYGVLAIATDGFMIAASRRPGAGVRAPGFLVNLGRMKA